MTNTRRNSVKLFRRAATFVTMSREAHAESFDLEEQ
jgi:hypothetical protein